MKSLTARAVALIAGLHILGGHWLVLQIAAWIGMFALHSQDASLADAVNNTFDGKHPCALCEVVSSGQEEEQDNDFVDFTRKIEAVLSGKISLPPVQCIDLSFFGDDTEPFSVLPEQYLPPPRLG